MAERVVWEVNAADNEKSANEFVVSKRLRLASQTSSMENALPKREVIS